MRLTYDELTDLREYQVPQLCNAVARVLGAGWSAELDQHGINTWLKGPDGALIIVRLDDRTGRLQLWGSMRLVAPDVNDRGGLIITVAATRTAGAIAGEIRGRLMPDYLVKLAEAKERQAEHVAAEKRCAEFREELIALGAEPLYGQAMLLKVGASSIRFDLRSDAIYIASETIDGTTALKMFRALKDA